MTPSSSRDGASTEPGAVHWLVWVLDTVRVSALRKELPALLLSLDRLGRLAAFGPPFSDEGDAIDDRLEALRVTTARRYTDSGSGMVRFHFHGQGGAVDRTGRSVPGWVSSLLREERRKDNLLKLARSNARERHVFIPIALKGAPWPVESYLRVEPNELPSDPPDLPSPVTAVWLAPLGGLPGVRWTGSEWRWFSTEP